MALGRRQQQPLFAGAGCRIRGEAETIKAADHFAVHRYAAISFDQNVG
jgi:hypothetical protein